MTDLPVVTGPGDPIGAHRPSSSREAYAAGKAITIDLASIEWCPAPEFNAYDVSECGHVRRRVAYRGYPAGRLLKLRHNRFGYFCVTLYRQGRPQDVFVHRLVALAFIGPQPSLLHEVAHGDGNKANNHCSNLRWATKSENCRQKREHGALPDIRGERHPGAKLTNQVVLALRRRRRQGAYFREIADEFGIPKLTVYDAVRGKTWSHI